MQAPKTVTEKLVGLVGYSGLMPLASQFFTVVAVLMAAALILMRFTLYGLKDSRAQGEATEDTLLEITTVDSRLIDSDFALNGYVLHPDPWFAARIASVRADTAAAMAKLQHSVAHDGDLAAQFRSIADAMKQRQALYDYLAQPQHQREVADLAGSAAAKAEHDATDGLRGRLWTLLRDERIKRQEKYDRVIAQAEHSFWIATAVVVLAMVSGAVNLLLMRAAARRP